QNFATLSGVRAVDADHDRRVDLDSAERLDDPVGHFIAAGDPTEDIDQDRPHVRVGVDHLERVRHDVRIRATTDVQEVCGRSTDLIYDVERAHRQAGAIGDDAHAAGQADVLQALA